MKRLLHSIDTFFFERISAAGFGLMRIAWAATVLIEMLAQWSDITVYYSDAGLITPELKEYAFRDMWRFTLLDWFGSPQAVGVLYGVLIVSCVYMLLGIWPRLTTIVSVLLFFSFNEDNLMILTGGDTALRNIGLLLMIAPGGVHALSLERVTQQWHHWREKRTLLPHLTMPIWPMRLLLWQFIVIYVTAAWEKAYGTMWWGGTAIESVFHHPHFFHWPRAVMDLISPISPFASYATMVFLFAWALLLIPRECYAPLHRRFPHWRLKRWLIAGGILFHGGILLTMNIGIFSLAMFTGYCGLLVAEDFEAFRRFFNRKWKGTIAVLHDGKCGLCMRSVFVLSLIDHLKRLRFVDFRNDAARKSIAPELRFEDLDRAMHIKLPSGRTESGFDAFRILCHHLPVCWLSVPLLYLPGVASIGRRVYANIAESRKRCSHENCMH